jgi:hypothetical protein
MMPPSLQDYKIIVKVIASKLQGSLVSRNFVSVIAISPSSEDINSVVFEITTEIQNQGGYQKADFKLLT